MKTKLTRNSSRRIDASLLWFLRSVYIPLQLQWICSLPLVFKWCSSVAVAAARRVRSWSRHCSPTWRPYKYSRLGDPGIGRPHPVRKPERHRGSADSTCLCRVPAIRRAPACSGRKLRNDEAVPADPFHIRLRSSFLEKQSKLWESWRLESQDMM